MAAFGPEGHCDAAHVRGIIRKGLWTLHTTGLAHGRVQGNLVILPEVQAGDFLRFCQRNPKPCPVLAVSEPGQFALPTLGDGIDIRSDVPQYRVWRHGELTQEVADIADLWRPDLVTFILGCSFSFESALQEAGISLRHINEGKNVAMYRTNIATQPAGPFGGAMVVSMRPMPAADVIRAVQVTSRFPNVHGAPVHIGDPALIGIADIARPDYGDAVPLMPGEIPVFWACGVTPQSAILNAQPAFCITHSPGCMLVTDLLNHHLASF
ncbi:putative hydro-lyase [Acidovorax sp. NPDC077693]|uniref:putative hydro-lyase n=1 Tax=unclassified Acidovorax TaxID=2684926 RepID=UPI0037C888FC